MSFQYTSLGSEELRLLKPIRGLDKSDLQFETAHVARDQAPAYTAISYTWGDEEPTEEIRLDGQTFKIRPNLWSCLFHLRASGAVYGWSHIWVDAICIDQTNDQERNAQVWSMDRTYQEAQCVSVWLGEPTETLHTEDFDWSKSMPEILRRPYWSRTWVIQEFLIGKKVKVHCGYDHIDWQDIFDMLPAHPAPVDTSSYKLLSGRRSMPIDHTPHLYHLLGKYDRSVCKDPRDRVFAMLGIVGPIEKKLLGRFFPDYTLSEDDVAILALAHCLQQDYKHADYWRMMDCLDSICRGLGLDRNPQKQKFQWMARSLDYSDQALSRNATQVIAYWESQWTEDRMLRDELQWDEQDKASWHQMCSEGLIRHLEHQQQR